MKVSCPSCQTNYNIDDKRIPAGGAKLKCAKCQNLFPIRAEGADALPLPGLAAPGSSPGSGAIPLPGLKVPGGGPSSAHPPPQGLGAIPLPGAAGASFATEFDSLPLPGRVPGQSAHSPLPGAIAPSAFAPPPPAALPLPGRLSPSNGHPLSPPADEAALPAPGHEAPDLFGQTYPGGSARWGDASPVAGAPSIPLPSAPFAEAGSASLHGSSSAMAFGSTFGDDTDGIPDASDDVELEASGPIPLPEGYDAPQGTARDFDFAAEDELPSPARAESAEPFSLPPVADAQVDVPYGSTALAGAAPTLDFSDLPEPASAGPGDFEELPPAPRAQSLDFSDLPAPAQADTSFEPVMDFGPPPTDSAPARPEPALPDFELPPEPPTRQMPNPSADFGDVDFGEPAAAAPSAAFSEADDPFASAPPEPSVAGYSAPSASNAEELEMLSFGDEGAPAAAPAPVADKKFQVRRRSGKVFGPFDEAGVVRMLEDGQLLGNEDVSVDSQSWTPIGTVPAFASAIQRMMEGPPQGAPASPAPGFTAPTRPSSSPMVFPVVESLKPQDAAATMDRLKQLYEGRMAAVSVVDRSEGREKLRKRIPYFIAGGALGLALLAGGSLSATRYGAFGLKKFFPTRVSPGSPSYADYQLARQELLRDTYQSYREARKLTQRVLTSGEYPEVRAVWCQAVFYLQRRYAAATPSELAEAKDALDDIDLLGERNVEALKARAGAALVAKSPDAVLAELQNAASREANLQDVELSFLLAEAYTLKGSAVQAAETLRKILGRQKDSAKAHHALGNLAQQSSQADEAAKAYQAALAADPLHVISAVELAAVQLLVRKDVEQGAAAVERALGEKAQSEMGPAEVARARSLRGLAFVLQSKPKEAEVELQAALEKDASNALAQLQLARLYRAQRRFAEALPFYQAASKAEPGNLEYAEGYIGTLVASGKMSDALSVVEAANARFPGNPRIAFLFGQIEEARDNAAGAESHYKRAIAADPAYHEAQLQLARFYLRFRRIAEARGQLEEAVAKAPQSPDVHAGLGELALAEGNREAARTELETAIQLDAGLADGHLGLSRLLLAEGRHDEALAEVDRALELTPGLLSGGRLQRGLVLWKKGSFEEAIAELEQAKSEDPRSVAIPIALGGVRLAKGDLAGAETSIALALRSEPSNAEALSFMGRIKAARSEFTQAIDSMKNAVDRAPKRADYRLALGNIYRDAKRVSEAIEQWKIAVEMDPSAADAHEALGQAFLDRGDFESAISAFEASLQADARRTRVLASIGDAYFNSARWDEAIGRYQHALKADPALTQVFYKVGRAYSEQGRHAQAIDWYKKATLQDGNNPMAFYYLGFAYKEKGQKPNAVQAFKQYLARKPGAEDKKDIEDEIYDLTH